MKQEIMRDGKVICVTSVSYPPNIIKDLQDSGHQVYQDGKLLARRGKKYQETEQSYGS